MVPVWDVEPLDAAWATAAPPIVPAAAITAMTLYMRGRIGDCLLCVSGDVSSQRPLDKCALTSR